MAKNLVFNIEKNETVLIAKRTYAWSIDIIAARTLN